jgi:hypothetical protein
MAKLKKKATKKTRSTDAAPLAGPDIGLFQMLCCGGVVYRLNTHNGQIRRVPLDGNLD